MRDFSNRQGENKAGMLWASIKMNSLTDRPYDAVKRPIHLHLRLQDIDIDLG